MKKFDKILKYLFITLDVMTILYCLENIILRYSCYLNRDININAIICNILFSKVGIKIYQLFGSANGLLLILNFPYFIYLLCTKKGIKKSILVFLINTLILITTTLLVLMCNVVGG